MKAHHTSASHPPRCSPRALTETAQKRPAPSTRGQENNVTPCIDGILSRPTQSWKTVLNHKIYLIGASGAGVSTLGIALARHLGVPHVDVDDHYWQPSDPPFDQAWPPERRLESLTQALGLEPWVISGSMDGWGDAIIAQADWVLYIDTPTPLRLARIRAREQQRFGARILPGGDMHARHLAFLQWAAAYDDGTREGRSRPRHHAWLARLDRPQGSIEGSGSMQQMLEQALAIIAGPA